MLSCRFIARDLRRYQTPILLRLAYGIDLRQGNAHTTSRLIRFLNYLYLQPTTTTARPTTTTTEEPKWDQVDEGEPVDDVDALVIRTDSH